MNVKIYEQKSYNLAEIEEIIDKIFEDFSIEEKLSEKKRILLKPNLLGAFSPERAVTTHPILIEAIIKKLIEMEKVVSIGDSPGGTVSPQKVFKETGIQKLIEKYDIELVNFNEKGVVKKEKDGFTYVLTKPVFDVDAIINLPKYKTHGLMLFTGAVKNLYGVIPGLKKSDYHKEYPKPNDFSKVIVDIYGFVKDIIVLNIMDGIVGMDGEGPSSGNPNPFGLIFVSEKASCLDYYASKIMGFDEIKYIQKSLVSDNISKEDISIKEKWKDFQMKNVDLKSVQRKSNFVNIFPKFIQDIFSNQFKYYPDFNEKCTKCQICVKGCPVTAIKYLKGYPHPIIDYKKCINCLCCHEFCPEDAIFINKSWLAKLLFK